MRFLRSLWPSHPPRDQATLDGLRLTKEIGDRLIEGRPVKRGEWERAAALLDNMPSYEDLYRRRPPSYEDWYSR